MVHAEYDDFFAGVKFEFEADPCNVPVPGTIVPGYGVHAADIACGRHDSVVEGETQAVTGAAQGIVAASGHDRKRSDKHAPKHVSANNARTNIHKSRVEAARAAVLIPGAGGITSAYVGGENGPLPEGLRKTCPLVSVKRRGRFVYHLKPAGTAASTLKATVEDVTDEEEGAGAGAGADADAESSDDDVVLFRLDNDI